jgi:hypothetical protein
MKRGPFIGLIYNPSQVFFEFKTTVLKRFIALATFLKKLQRAIASVSWQNVYSRGHNKWKTWLCVYYGLTICGVLKAVNYQKLVQIV